MDKLDSALISRAAGDFFTVRVTDSVSSTNDRLKEQAGSLDSGFVLVAGSQSGGRGRNGKTFCSEPGGLYMSLLLKEQTLPRRITRYTAAAAVALNRAILSVCGLETDIKWVNDIYCRGSKLAGILCETSLKSGRPVCEYIIVGIGVNVYNSSFPPHLSGVATSLRLENRAADINLLAGRILKNFVIYKDSGSMMEIYRRRSCVIGKDVCISGAGRPRPVKVLDADSDGALIVREKDGTLTRLCSGGISLVLG